MHNWCIDLRSGVAVAPDEGAAQSRAVREEDGLVWLQWLDDAHAP